MSSRFEGWRNALSWKSLLGSIDERGGSLLGELSWSRVTPSRWFSPRTGDPSAPSQDLMLTTAIAVTGIAAVAVASVVLRSTLKTSFWRAKLRDAKTGGPACGPEPLPFLGNVLELRSGYYETLYRFVDQPAAVFWVMSTPFVVINSEEGVRAVLGGSGGRYQKPKYFGYRSRTVAKAVESKRAEVAAESPTYDPHADSSRAALNTMVKSSFSTITASMDKLMNALADASEPIDELQEQQEALRAVRKFLVGLNLNVLFGLSERDSNTSRAAEMIEFAGAEFARRMVNPLRVLVDLPGNLRYVRDVGGLIGLGRRLCAKLDDAVASAASGPSSDSSSPSPQEREESGAGLGWVHAWVGKVGKIGKLGKVVGLLMASSQTVPITAVWMLHLVAKHDDVRASLRNELRDLGVNDPSDLMFEHMEKMPFAESVIRETLRLYPPFPLIQREAQEDDVLGGITIPARTIVYIVPWLIHRNPGLWRSPHEFRPSRFFEGDMAHGDAPSDWAFIPFGRGPRMCAGSQLALTELKVLLAFALLRFEWSTSNDDRDSPYPQLGMIPRGVRLSVKRLPAE